MCILKARNYLKFYAVQITLSLLRNKSFKLDPRIKNYSQRNFCRGYSRPATKRGPGGECPPDNKLAPLNFSVLLFILLYLVYVALQTLVCPPPSLKYFAPPWYVF